MEFQTDSSICSLSIQSGYIASGFFCYIAMKIAMENHNFLDYLQPINNPGSCVFLVLGGFSKSKTSKGKSHRTISGPWLP
jgi:hypothetical protein